MNEETDISSEIPREKKRARKKQLYTSIKDLMEFYFSAANLSRDRWLAKALDESGYMLLSHFLNFNKIRALTNNVNDIVKALKNSEVLEVTEDCKVRRMIPVEFKENPDDCTIYVEQIPPDANHDWLKSFFSCYGVIDYISIPRYQTSKKCKGFAFIEFKNQETAEKVIEDYKKAGHYLSNNIEPQELLSISTFDKKNIQQTNLLMEINSEKVEAEPEISSNKRRRPNEISEEECSEVVDAVNSKRLKLVEEEECNDNVQIVQSSNPTGEELNSEECSESFEGNADESKKKKNRKKKRKAKKNKITPETTGFQILSKKDWKYLRNKYLNIQRDKMKQLKKHLRQTQMKTIDRYQMKQTKKTKENTNNVNDKERTVAKDFVPGLIVKIEVTEPIVNLVEFKAEVRSKTEDVKYIDVKEGSFSAFIRLATPEAANDFCEKSVWNSAEILKDDEEFSYWEKLEKDRQTKLSKTTQKVKKRGKEKILKRAEKLLEKHIIFDDAS